jgi:hypothetical protein
MGGSGAAGGSGPAVAGAVDGSGADGAGGAWEGDPGFEVLGAAGDGGGVCAPAKRAENAPAKTIIRKCVGPAGHMGREPFGARRALRMILPGPYYRSLERGKLTRREGRAGVGFSALRKSASSFARTLPER